MTDLETIAVEQTVCPSCDARPGEPCRTRRDTLARVTHAPRMDPLREAFAVGYDEGYEGGRSHD